MNITFAEKVVLITGASTGIGAALARAFGAAKARVIVHYGQSAEAAQGVAHDIEASGGEALLVQADVTKTEQLEKLRDTVLQRFGQVDILINNAGSLVKRTPIPESTDELVHEIFDINFTSTVAMCRLIVPAMQRQGGGNIINLTSIAARNGGGNGAVLYASSKGAVSTFTRGLARELAPHKIRVNALSPGVILTPFHERYSTQAQVDAMVATIPMGRAGQPEECVGTVFYLASDTLSGYVTGQIIEVNGGQYMP